MKKLIYQTLNKKYLIILIILLLVITFLFIPEYSYAEDNPLVKVMQDVGKAIADQTVGRAFKEITQLFKDLLSWVLDSLVKPLLINVMSYTNFFSNGVNAGWTVVRDFANLFFALILLIIAIATVLNVGPLDNYTAKRMLPSFIFVALFINFSKAIVGFFIDISQIIMITFYNAFGPNLMDSITRASKLAESVSKSQTDQGYINLLIIITLIILISTLLWTAIILAIRIVYLWVIIMISPIAFLSLLVPALKSIADDWKNKFQEALVVGPTIMFLLYLAVAVMNNGISGNQQTTGGSNLFDNGNFIDFVFVIILFFLANSIAMKAGQSAPPMLQKAVGIGTTLATFGAGKYVGAGGYGTGQMLKTGKEYIKGGVKNVDKVAGGATNVAGVVGSVTGNKKLKNANQAYESKKRDLLEQQKTGVGFAGNFQGLSAEGKKQQLEDYEKEKAIKLYNQNQLEEKGNERYKKIAATLQATAATEVKDEYNVTKLGEQMKEALEEGDKFTAMALATRISELKGWNKIFTEGEYSTYSDPSNGYDSDAKQLDAFINDKFEIKDSAGEILDSKTMNSFRSRQANILNDKGAGNFAAGLAERDVTNINYSPARKAAKAGIIGAGAAIAKNNAVFNRKRITTNASTGEDVYEDYFDINEFAPVIAKESQPKNLENPQSWNQYGDIKNEIIEGIKKYLNADNDTRQGPQYSNIYNKIDDNKLKAALKGLGSSASSRVTSS